MKELRATIEAERAHEQEMLKAKLAEAEALVAAAKALAQQHATLQVQSAATNNSQEVVSISSLSRLGEAYAAQTSSTPAPVQPVPSGTLKRKRDELEEEAEPSASSVTVAATNSHRCCAPASPSSELTDGRPIKRRRSLAMRLVSGVAKTTAIAAVGAVATWSALAFT